MLEAGVELPETLNKRFTAENIEEIKLFAKTLQQQKKQEVQHNVERVKNLLQTTQAQQNEAPISNPPVSHKKMQLYNSYNVKNASYDRK